MKNVGLARKTVVSGEYYTQTRSERQPIGFRRNEEVAEGPAPIETVDISRALRRGELDDTIVAVVRAYMEERLIKCYREGLDKDLMIKMDKIFIKYYEKIA